jgi:hypothetical protein
MNFHVAIIGRKPPVNSCPNPVCLTMKNYRTNDVRKLFINLHSHQLSDLILEADEYTINTMIDLLLIPTTVPENAIRQLRLFCFIRRHQTS